MNPRTNNVIRIFWNLCLWLCRRCLTLTGRRRRLCHCETDRSASYHGYCRGRGNSTKVKVPKNLIFNNYPDLAYINQNRQPMRHFNIHGERRPCHMTCAPFDSKNKMVTISNPLLKYLSRTAPNWMNWSRDLPREKPPDQSILNDLYPPFHLQLNQQIHKLLCHCPSPINPINPGRLIGLL